jgi:hypothetical protein
VSMEKGDERKAGMDRWDAGDKGVYFMRLG